MVVGLTFVTHQMTSSVYESKGIKKSICPVSPIYPTFPYLAAIRYTYMNLDANMIFVPKREIEYIRTYQLLIVILQLFSISMQVMQHTSTDIDSLLDFCEIERIIGANITNLCLYLCKVIVYLL